MADMASARAGQDGVVASGEGPRTARPGRRSFTAEYKMRIVAEYDQLDDPGARGALLRREGLYTSHISRWRQARDQGAAGGLAESRPGGPGAVRRTRRMSGCGRRTRNSPPSWRGPRPPWRSWEKRARSWNCSPGARTPTRSGGGNRHRFHRARAAHLGEKSL